jgi:hypothetical protein
MKKLLMITGIALSLTACGGNQEDARKALSSMGFTQIKVGEYAFWGCDKNDSFKSKFTAVNAQGQAVSGVLCGGIMKRITVRF